MVIKKAAGSAPTQCTLVKQGRQTSTCGNLTGTMTQMNAAIIKNGVATLGPYSSRPSFTTIRNVTVDGGGVLARVAWDSGASVGHIAPVIGSSASPDKVYITYIREGAVSGSWVSYAAFRDGTAGLGASDYTPTHYLTT